MLHSDMRAAGASRPLQNENERKFMLTYVYSERECSRLRSYGHFYISKMAVSRHLGFLKFESCTIRSTDAENPTLELNIMSLYIDMYVLCERGGGHLVTVRNFHFSFMLLFKKSYDAES